MRRISAWIEAFALTIGGFGIFVIAFLDSSFLSFPEVIDFLVILMVVRHAASGALRLADPTTRGEIAGLGACNGDSGGPVLEHSGGRLALVGVVSWATDARRGAGCGGLTGVVPLPHFRDWLAETSAKLGSPVQP